MDKRIIDFIKENQLLSFSVIDANGVYCASCYYVFDEEDFCFFIKSDEQSKHIQLAHTNPNIAITIAKDSSNLALLRGVQIKALFKKADKKDETLYYKRFPFAKLGAGEIYSIRILWAKYTDNKLLLSKKITYTR